MVGVDADADPAVVHLADDPTIGTLVTARPGIRVPGAWGPLEVAIHAIVAQHCSLARARARMGTLVRNFGQPVPGLAHKLTHLFPSADVLAGANLAAIDLPRTTVAAIQAFAAGMAGGDVVLDSSLGLSDLVASLTAVPGIGATAAHQVALRLGQRDAFPESDPYVRWALRALNAPGPAEQIAPRWRPWRAVAATHLVTYTASRASTPAMG
jgi:AraC family transcriptional regulator, regulatory protein of adaptative response / DNA-3-methyladenine glycosylase II